MGTVIFLHNSGAPYTSQEWVWVGGLLCLAPKWRWGGMGYSLVIGQEAGEYGTLWKPEV